MRLAGLGAPGRGGGHVAACLRQAGTLCGGLGPGAMEKPASLLHHVLLTWRQNPSPPRLGGVCPWLPKVTGCHQ